jgi:hypothetical protein
VALHLSIYKRRKEFKRSTDEHGKAWQMTFCIQAPRHRRLDFLRTLRRPRKNTEKEGEAQDG